jgi:hypothetical protein
MANPNPPQPDPVYLGLRHTLFTADPAGLGLAPSERLPQVWAALMEIDLGGAVASVVAVADGTTSLYISNGGGVIGTGAYPAVAGATAAFLDAAQAYLRAGWFAPVAEPPLPGPDRVRFTVLTYAGPHSVDAVTESLPGGGEPLSALFGAGNDVLTQIRLVQEAQDRRG